ncbi:hypothetical protein CK230_28090 [Mesorhizobium sp. WSM3859]|nr:hypothetical protein CK230_28090 [Mesorhizobium sp. WSM3859]
MVDAAVGGALLGMCLGVRVDHGGLIPQTSSWHICRPMKLPRKRYITGYFFLQWEAAGKPGQVRGVPAWRYPLAQPWPCGPHRRLIPSNTLTVSALARRSTFFQVRGEGETLYPSIRIDLVRPTGDD